jgi:hypothetical protein
VISVAVKHVVLANECHNIMNGLNAIKVDQSGSVTTLIIPPAFYSHLTLATAINVIFQNFDDVNHTYVSIATDGRSLLFTLPANISIVSGGSSDVYIGLDETSSGSFSATPYLGSPHSVAFVCPQFDHVYTVMSGIDSGIRPFVIMPMNNGYNQHEIYSPQQLFHIPTSSTVLDLLRIRIVDPCTSVLQNVNHWSIELEIKSN